MTASLANLKKYSLLASGFAATLVSSSASLVVYDHEDTDWPHQTVFETYRNLDPIVGINTTPGDLDSDNMGFHHDSRGDIKSHSELFDSFRESERAATEIANDTSIDSGITFNSALILESNMNVNTNAGDISLPPEGYELIDISIEEATITANAYYSLINLEEDIDDAASDLTIQINRIAISDAFSPPFTDLKKSSSSSFMLIVAIALVYSYRHMD